jgi:anti-anti-sigma factor
MLIEPATGESIATRPRIELREVSGHTTIVALSGEHDLFTRHQLEQKLEMAQIAALVIVDLTVCTFLDSTIIESLLKARHRMRVEIVMPALGSIADRALRITGAPDFFTTYSSLGEALEHAQSPSTDP